MKRNLGYYLRASVGALAAVVGLCTEADCLATQPGLDRFYTDGWGFDPRNTRHQGPARSRLNRANVGRLELKWVHALADTASRTMPLVTEDTVFVGDAGEGLLALDRKTGCRRWLLDYDGQIASAIVHERTDDGVRLFFADRNAGMVAVDATTGTLIWQREPTGSNPVAMYSGSPLLHGDTLFVPISSQEIGLAAIPFYGCCHTSGGFAALSSATGNTLWSVPTIEEPVHTTGYRWLVVKKRGPSGAPVWGAAMYDGTRRQVVFGTGQNYSHPTTETSDAIIALDVATGARRWVRQFTANDAFNMACTVPGHPNCPEPIGPDLDFGAPPVLVTLADGTDAVIAGQKSGDVHAMRAEDGEPLWQTKVGRGGPLGGIHWGIAVANGIIYAPISDVDSGPLTGAGKARPGVHALSLDDGRPVWSHVRKARCPGDVCSSQEESARPSLAAGSAGVSAAISVTDEVVFAASLDGWLEALDAATGELLWSFDSWREFDAVNGTASGGSFDAHGAMLADDLLLITSGYGGFGQRPGNALLVFGLPEDAP